MSRQKFVFQQLQQSIKDGDRTTMEHILKWEYKKDQLFELNNDEGLTLVHIACLEGRLKCLDALLRHGASVHLKSSVGWTPLHAATLGGKLDVVSYLLNDCSADPLAMDEMGCLPSDLTMDKDILEVLNTHAHNANLKKDLESLASKMSSMKHRTFSHAVESTTPSRPAAHTQSMFCNQAEASQIRIHYARSKEEDFGTTLNTSDTHLKIPKLKLQNSNNNDVDFTLPDLPISNIMRTQSDLTFSSKKRHYYTSSHDSKDVHNTEVIRRKASTSSVGTISPSTPRAFKFFTIDTSRRSREMRNRDSGVFDDDAESDVSESSSKRRANSEQDHYNVI